MCLTKHKSTRFQGNMQVHNPIYYNELGYPSINMVKVKRVPDKFLEFPIGVGPRVKMNNKITIRIDTDADRNYVNENTFKAFFSQSAAVTLPCEHADLQKLCTRYFHTRHTCNSCRLSW